jgi:SNF2 family DNA or RNA helicase
MTLDVIERGLNQANIQSTRFDGKVSQKDRGIVVEKFKKDPNIRVMLLTLSCGAVGYVRPCFTCIIPFFLLDS